MSDLRRGLGTSPGPSLGRSIIGIACAAICFPLIQQPSQISSEGFHSLLVFDVMSTSEQFAKPIAGPLVVRVARERAIGLNHYGWLVSVESPRSASGNLLYKSLHLHGPHPSELYAWHFTDIEKSPQTSGNSPGGSVRILPVYGYPWEIRLECSDCRVQEAKSGAEFVAGTVRIAARRLQRPNPPQLR